MAGINVNIQNHKRIVKNSRGDIIDLSDSIHGPIVSKGRVVNQEAWDELQKIEADKREAAKAIAMAVNNPNAPVADRNAAPSKVEELSKRIDAQDAKLDAILAALKK